MIDIKFIPTGHVFSLPDDEAKRIVKEDRGNYEVIKGEIVFESEPPVKKSVVELVVVDDEKSQLIEKAKSLLIPGNLSAMKIETLKKKIAEKEQTT